MEQQHTTRSRWHRVAGPATVAIAVTISGISSWAVTAGAETATATVRPIAEQSGPGRTGDNRSAVDELLGLILGPSFPNVRAWAESFDAYAYPDRCHQTVAVPCP